MIRVRVVDDRDGLRTSIRVALEACPDINVVDTMDHSTALQPNLCWDGIDVVIVDAADDRKADDQFPGVAVVERIRSSPLNRQPNVIVVTGYAVHDGLRVRMREAGADWFLHRTNIDADIVRAVQTPRSDFNGVPDPVDRGQLEEMGWNSRSKINDAIRWAIETNQINGLRPSTRRALQAARRTFTELTKVDPRNNNGTSPQRRYRGRPVRQDAVSAAQANRLLRWATKINNNH